MKKSVALTEKVCYNIYVRLGKDINFQKPTPNAVEINKFFLKIKEKVLTKPQKNAIIYM